MADTPDLARIVAQALAEARAKALVNTCWSAHALRVVRSAIAATLVVAAAPAAALTLKDSPMLADKVASGVLPAVAERVPRTPRVVEPLEPGRHGGDLRVIMARARDTRLMVVYGYARLVGYALMPDILETFESVESRHPSPRKCLADERTARPCVGFVFGNLRLAFTPLPLLTRYAQFLVSLNRA